MKRQQYRDLKKAGALMGAGLMLMTSIVWPDMNLRTQKVKADNEYAYVVTVDAEKLPTVVYGASGSENYQFLKESDPADWVKVTDSNGDPLSAETIAAIGLTYQVEITTPTVDPLNTVPLKPVDTDKVTILVKDIADTSTEYYCITSTTDWTPCTVTEYETAALDFFGKKSIDVTSDLSFSVTPKKYDGTTTATASVTVNSDAIVTGDVVTVTADAAFADANAGSDKTVNLTNLVLGGADAAYYELSATTATTTASIAPADGSLILTIQANNRDYVSDSTAVSYTVDASMLEGTGVSVDETALASVTASMTDANAGIDKPITLSDGTLTNLDAIKNCLTGPVDNYNYSLDGLKVTINPLTLTATADAEDKTYDGTTDVNNATLTLTGVTSETVTLSEAELLRLQAIADTTIFAYADANAAEDKAVTITYPTLTGDDAINYQWPTDVELKSTIEPFALPFTYNGSAITKAYDGTTDLSIALSDVSIDTTGAPTTVTLTAVTAAYADANASDSIDVTMQGTLSDATNYKIEDLTIQNCSITTKELTLKATAENKKYDGTTVANGTIEIEAGIVGTDEVSLDLEAMTAAYDDASIQNGKTVTFTGYQLTGADAANYSVADSVTATANIALTVTISVSNAAGEYKDYVICSDGSLTSDLVDADLDAAHIFNSMKKVLVTTDYAGEEDAAPTIAVAFVDAASAPNGVGTDDLATLTYGNYFNGVTPSEDGKFYVYVMITDAASGVTYYAEAGALYDNTAPTVDTLDVTSDLTGSQTITLQKGVVNILESYATDTTMKLTVKDLTDESTASYSSGLKLVDGVYTDVECMLYMGDELVDTYVVKNDGTKDYIEIPYLTSYEGQTGALFLSCVDIAGNPSTATYRFHFPTFAPVVSLIEEDTEDTVLEAGVAAIYTNHTGLAVTLVDASAMSFGSMKLTVTNTDTSEVKTYTTVEADGNTYTIADIETLEDGTYTAELTIVSSANVANTYTYYFIVETIAPEIVTSYDPDTTVDAMDGYVSVDQRLATVTITDENIGEKENFTVTITKFNRKGVQVGDAYELDNAADYLSAIAGGYKAENIVFETGATYEVVYRFKDRAGNIGEKTDKFTVDSNLPTVQETDLTATIALDLLEKLSFGTYFGEVKTILVKANDANSPIKSVDYYIDYPTDVLTVNGTQSVIAEYATSLTAIEDIAWENLYTYEEETYVSNVGGSFDLTVNKNAIYYVRVTDFAGNVSYYRNDKVVTVDTKAPSITFADDFSMDITKENVEVTFTVKEGDYTGVSGLKTVDYSIIVDGTVIETKNLYTNSDPTKKLAEDTYKVTIKATTYNSNDIKIAVTAVDMAEHSKTKNTYINIDTTKPVISVSNEEAVNHKGNQYYYTGAEHTTVTITERNFVAENTKIVVKDLTGAVVSPTRYSVSDWTTTKGTAANGDDTTNTAVITFQREGDYQVIVDTKDAAGNPAKTYTASNYITVDKTNPTLAISFAPKNGRNGSYFKDTRTMTIEVTEHNFDPQGCVYNITYTDVNGNEIQAPTVDRVLEETKWTSNGDVHTATLKFNGSFNYNVSVAYTDLAKRTAETKTATFAVDTVAPTGTISIGALTATDELKTGVAFDQFTNAAQTVTITATDAISPIESVSYYVADVAKTRAALESYTGWTDLPVNGANNQLAGAFVLNKDAKVIVYAKLVDAAGNITYLGTDGVIFDTTRPEPAITITSIVSGNDGTTSFYNKDVVLSVKVEDPTVNGAYAGLSSVRYEIYKDGKVTTEGNLKLDGKGPQTVVDQILVSATENNSNNIKVMIYAEDLAGNKADQDVAFAIDATSPTITTSMSQTSLGTFYGNSASATATISITERNFDAKKVAITATKDGKPTDDYTLSTWEERVGRTPDDTMHVATIVFGSDGDYDVNVSCIDYASNASVQTTVGQFTVDRTAPVISWAIDQNQEGDFYKEGKKVTVFVKEHNFVASSFIIKSAGTTADSKADAITMPAMSDWTQDGDTYSASFMLKENGVYNFSASGYDSATNAANTATIGLTIDQGAPECSVKINGKDGEQMAFNEDAISLVVSVKDEFAIDPASINLVVTELISGQKITIPAATTVKNSGYADKDYALNATYVLDSLERDGIYSVSVEGSDLAGNAFAKQEKQFAISRNGSIFYLKLAEEVENDTFALVTQGYTTTAPSKDFVIREFNPSKLGNTDQTTTISVETLNHGTFTLKEGTDYSVVAANPFGGASAAYETVYAINPSVFSVEDQYVISIISEDSAGNKTNSSAVSYMSVGENGETSVEEGNAVYGFIFDSTAPTALFEGISNTTYNATSIDFTINTNTGDLSGIAKIAIDIAGKAYSYEYDAASKKFVVIDPSGKKLPDNNGIIKDNKNGTITVTVPSSNKKQNIAVSLTDFAGNTSEPITYNIMVSTNALARMFSQLWSMLLFIFSILLVIAGAIVAFIVIRKKKM